MTMSDQVACAIHAAIAELPAGGGAAEWQALDEGRRAPFRAAAARAISAMRTPSDAMLAEGNRRDMPRDAGNIWERMVYRALYAD